MGVQRQRRPDFRPRRPPSGCSKVTTRAIRVGPLPLPLGVAAGAVRVSRPIAATIVVSTIAAAPLIWLLGASVIAYHAAAFAALLALLFTDRSRSIRIGATEVLLGGYLLSYALSLLINASAAEPDRVLASAYNLSVWAMGAVMVFVGRNISSAAFLAALQRALSWLLICILFATCYAASALFTGYEHLVLFPIIHFPFPLSIDIGGDDLLVTSVRLNIVVRDWLLDTTIPRLAVFAPYPVALAGLILCCVPMVLSRCFNGPRRSLIAAGIGILALVPFAWTMSRVALVSLALASLIALSSRYVHRAVVFLGATVIVALLSFLVATFFYDFFWLREASTFYRLEMYRHALQTTLEHSPLTGLGVKPRVSMFTIPVGSHSTYLGAFTKAGAVGASILFPAILRIGYRAILVAARTTSPSHLASSISVLAMLFWMTTEDIDAPQLVAFLFWLHVGLLEGPYPVTPVAGGALRGGRAIVTASLPAAAGQSFVQYLTTRSSILGGDQLSGKPVSWS